MVKNEVFFDALKANGINFYCGVPDSLLKNFCAFLTDQTSKKEHIITANEGGAIALGCGYHLATGKIPMIYLQNSGLGNTVNPLLSLADNEVYGIPMLVMIGWRGEPGIHDEPQHLKQGRVQNAMLEAMEIPYCILDAATQDIDCFVKKAVTKAVDTRSPVAIVVRKDTFESYILKSENGSDHSLALTRDDAIHLILDRLSNNDVVVSTTGMSSREVYEYRVAKKQGHKNDFLMVGSMGHCSQIALGVALQTNRKVYCLDGDGAVIMHMGSLSIIGNTAPTNFKHIVLNNGAHDSVGGQPTVAFDISIPEIAKANGYKHVFIARNEEELNITLDTFLNVDGPLLLEVRLQKGARKDLGRPASTPEENKQEFIKFLKLN